MIYLPDVNVWIALSSDWHIHHAVAHRWLHTSKDCKLVFCRITEMGFLRLLTNRNVMQNDTCTAVEAWKVYDRWRNDYRVDFHAEGANFSETWRRTVPLIGQGPNAWTDAYISAFAAQLDATVITFDARFPTLAKTRIQKLPLAD